MKRLSIHKGRKRESCRAFVETSILQKRRFAMLSREKIEFFSTQVIAEVCLVSQKKFQPEIPKIDEMNPVFPF
jgi:hypothetical protein